MAAPGYATFGLSIVVSIGIDAAFDEMERAAYEDLCKEKPTRAKRVRFRRVWRARRQLAHAGAGVAIPSVIPGSQAYYMGNALLARREWVEAEKEWNPSFGRVIPF